MNEAPPARLVSKLVNQSIALVLAGGRGTRLNALTKWRAKPAVPFGGAYRIADFALSNCINSGIRRIGVLTQYRAHSLIRHIQKGWNIPRGQFNEFIELLPAQQHDDDNWYLGTADAVYQNIEFLTSNSPEYVVILAGDHIYKMDYGPMLADHVRTGAAVTVGCIEVPVEEASEFGIMAIDSDSRITRFSEKPEVPETMPGRSDLALASMGIYIFKRKRLVEMLIADAADPDSSHDFGRDVIPALLASEKVQAYPFRKAMGATAYWRDVGTIDSYWKTNMELIGVTPELNLYDRDWPIWTHMEQTPPAKFVFDEDDRRGSAVDSLVSGGCIVSGSTIRHSLLFNNARTEINALVENSVVLPDVVIGANCRIRNTIIDRGARLAEGTVIGENIAEDRARFHVSEGGVVLVTPEMLGQNLHGR